MVLCVLLFPTGPFSKKLRELKEAEVHAMGWGEPLNSYTILYSKFRLGGTWPWAYHLLSLCSKETVAGGGGLSFKSPKNIKARLKSKAFPVNLLTNQFTQHLKRLLIVLPLVHWPPTWYLQYLDSFMNLFSATQKRRNLKVTRWQPSVKRVGRVLVLLFNPCYQFKL